MKIDISLLKKLREITLAPIKDCKECLIEANWDLDKAQEILKEKWKLKALKKADRETKEWIVKVAEKWGFIVWIKLACETDFVAKNESFHALAEELLTSLADYGIVCSNIDEIDSSVLDQFNKKAQEAIVVLWENIKIVDLFVTKLSSKSFIYRHPWDKIVWIVYYKWEKEDIAKEIALQIVAMNPQYLNIESIDSSDIEKMNIDFMKELEGSNKPKDILEKIVEWKRKKYYSEIVLLEQTYIRDDSKKIKEILWNDFEIIWYNRFWV